MPTRCNNQRGSGPNTRSHKQELWFFAGLLALCNLPGLSAQLQFFPAAVLAGQWWRIATHPFVHVSWYHLLLDGAAFLFLYSSLQAQSRTQRLCITSAALVGSLGFAWWLAPQVRQLGLCGLSGVAHGLMAVTAIELIARDGRKGWPVLAAVVAKSAWEAVTGHVFFEALHFGLMGTPIAVCHLGGVLGGVAGFFGSAGHEHCGNIGVRVMGV